jgi:hypothetical protein
MKPKPTYLTTMKRVTLPRGQRAWEVRDPSGRLIVQTGSRDHAGRIRNQAEADAQRIAVSKPTRKATP